VGGQNNSNLGRGVETITAKKTMKKKETAKGGERRKGLLLILFNRKPKAKIRGEVGGRGGQGRAIKQSRPNEKIAAQIMLNHGGNKYDDISKRSHPNRNQFCACRVERKPKAKKIVKEQSDLGFTGGWVPLSSEKKARERKTSQT